MNFLGTNFRLHNKRLAVTILIILTLLLVACGGGQTAEEPPAEEVPADSTTSEEEIPTEEITSEEAEEPMEEETGSESMMQGGILRIASQPIVQIDPGLVSSDAEVMVANAVYDYLVDVNENNNIVPRLAKSWTQPDNLTYVFALEDGVTFHDGSPFTAADVVWTFDRLRDPDLGLPTSSLYENIDTIEATGDLQVTFKLINPNPFFLFDLSDNHALVLKAGTEDADTNFNGTGAFKVISYSPEDRLRMEANPGYFVEGEPHLAGIEMVFFNDQRARIDALRDGQADLVINMSVDDFVSLRSADNLATFSANTNAFDLVRLRSDREPGNDPRIMQALRLATDRNAISNVVLQGFGAVGQDNPIGPLYSSYHDPEAVAPEPDVEAAKALLADAGYPEGLSMTLYTPDSGNRPALAAVLKEMWAQAGFNVDIVVEPESVYYGEDPDTGEPKWLSVDLGITGWGSRPYPQFYLDVMLVCDAKWNESHFCDEEFDALVQTAGTTHDEAERIQAYKDIQALLIERGPVMIPYFFAQFGGISDQFTGFTMKAFPGRSDLRTVQLADR